MSAPLNQAQIPTVILSACIVGALVLCTWFAVRLKRDLRERRATPFWAPHQAVERAPQPRFTPEEIASLEGVNLENEFPRIPWHYDCGCMQERGLCDLHESCYGNPFFLAKEDIPLLQNLLRHRQALQAPNGA